jgi:hypothetical protein
MRTPSLLFNDVLHHVPAEDHHKLLCTWGENYKDVVDSSPLARPVWMWHEGKLSRTSSVKLSRSRLHATPVGIALQSKYIRDLVFPVTAPITYLRFSAYVREFGKVGIFSILQVIYEI